ncbi:MAG: secondary thiamine-phosphate synthase enzyme YjbQ [Candidatus Acidiferrales bacterium]|jgi:secondary thiamine-phosphate synthase enzyme
MKIYTDVMTFQTEKKREFLNITPQVKAALEKSGFRDGFILVSVTHSNAAIIVSDDEPGLLEDLQSWIEQVAPEREDYKHRGRFESNTGIHLQSLLLHHQVVVPFTEGRMDLGPWQYVLFAELDGQRPKRVVIKAIGE